MKELVELLNQASKAYYQQDTEIMSNLEYDALYDELVALEQETGLILSKSPTQHVGFEVISELPKERHPAPMLSLDKTKSVEDLAAWLGDKTGVMSWKMDGLTVVLTYEDGVLVKAVTRGNGEIGEVITNNAKVFANLPNQIAYKSPLTIRGEAVITYTDFERINATIPDIDSKYKNPRNLCSGSVRQLNNQITAERNVHFFAFNMLDTGDAEIDATMNSKFDFLTSLGFEVVEHVDVTAATMQEMVTHFAEKIETNDFPSDGLVLSFDDVEYGKSLGRTAKFPRDSIAFKWADEEAETTLRHIEWSPSRTGLINPVAVFDAVSLEGTSVSRASVHNVSIVKQLQLGIGDTIKVYKANMIIPQIAENLTGSDNVEIPKVCPVCGQPTEIRQMNEVQTLYCTNEKCPAKEIKAYTLFVSRDALNIDGLSEATLEKMIDQGFIHEYADLFRLDRYKEVITQMEGFGEKSYQNMIDSIEAARHTTLPRLIYGLGIAGIGVANAKVLCRYFDYDLEKMQSADTETLSAIPGVGEVLAGAFTEYMSDAENLEQIEHLKQFLIIEVPQVDENAQTLSGMSFVVTGSLNHYASRNDLKEVIEERGGKVTGSVTGKTTCLINNDITSTSSKNKKAKELQVPILTEEDFLKTYNIPYEE